MKHEDTIYIQDGAIVMNVRPMYVVEMERCNTPAKILEWVYHLSQKNWVDREVIERFILLACSANGIDPYAGT